MAARCRALGFSLLELVTIIVVIGALVVFAVPRLRTSDASLLTSRDAIVAALAHAQQAAMARDSAGNPITVVINANTIDVRENGVSVDLPGTDYPLVLPNGVTVTAGLGTLHYDKLGHTTPTSISLNSGGVSVTVEASGYAH